MKHIGRLKGRIQAAKHKGYVRAFSKISPYYLVNEFPKSGGTWLALMLADALDLPFRRNQPIRFERSVTHGHFLSPLGLSKPVLVWRDPRDLLVSFYYHSYFVNEHNNRSHVALMKAACPFENYNNIQVNLPAFIQFVTETPVTPKFSWPQFAEIWVGRSDAVHTKYESLRANTADELTRIVKDLTNQGLSPERAEEVIEMHSFARAKAAAEQSKPDGSEISFIREGALGGWRLHFTAEGEKAMMDSGYENMLIKLGYKA